MPIIQSAIKRNKQAQVRRLHNLAVKSAVKADVRAVNDALATGDAKKAAEAFRAAASEIDRAVKKGTLHANTAARKKSRLNSLVKKTLAGEVKAIAKPKASAKKKPAAKKSAAKKKS